MDTTQTPPEHLGAAVRALRPDALAVGIVITDDWCRDQMHALGITRYEDCDDATVGVIADRVNARADGLKAEEKQ